MASSSRSAYELERQERIERNAEAMKVLLGVDVRGKDEAKQKKVKEKRVMNTRGDLSVATPSMRASVRLKQRETRTPRISYREQDDDDQDDNNDDELEEEEEEEYMSGEDEEEDDDDDEGDDDSDEVDIVKRKKSRGGSSSKAISTREKAHIEIDDEDEEEDEDAQLARAIRLSMEAHVSEPTTTTMRPSSSMQRQLEQNVQAIKRGKKKTKTKKKTTRAEESDGGKATGKRKKKKTKQQHKPQAEDVEDDDDEDAIDAVYANIGADIPDGPLIELFSLLAGGADRTIGRRELLIAVQRHASLLNDPTQFTEDTMNNMIVVANDCRGGGNGSSEANDTIDIKAFAAFVRQKLPRIFDGR